MARKIIGEELEFLDDKHTISYRFRPFQDVRETVDRLVEIAEKFIQAFSNYVLYEDKQEMWEQFEYNL